MASPPDEILRHEYEQANRILAKAQSKQPPTPKGPPPNMPAPGGTFTPVPQSGSVATPDPEKVAALKSILLNRFVGQSWRHVLSAHTTKRPGGCPILVGGIQNHYQQVTAGSMVKWIIDLPSTWEPYDNVRTTVEGAFMPSWQEARENCCFAGVQTTSLPDGPDFLGARLGHH